MDKIFAAALNCDDPSKKATIAEACIKAAANNQLSDENAQKLFELCVERIFKDSNDQTIGLSWRMFRACSANTSRLESFVTCTKIECMLKTEIQYPVRAVLVLQEVMALLQNTATYETLCKAVVTHVPMFILRNANYNILPKLCDLLAGFSDDILFSEGEFTLWLAMITGISMVRVPEVTADTGTYAKTCPIVYGSFFAKVWQRADENLNLACLQTIFELITVPLGDRGSKVSPGLGSVLRFVPDPLMSLAFSELLSRASYEKEIFNVVAHFIDWVYWPSTERIADWTIELLKSIEQSYRFAQLHDAIITEMVEKLVPRLRTPLMRENSFKIFEYMIRECQPSDACIQKLLSAVPVVYQSIRREASLAGEDFRRRFVELVSNLDLKGNMSASSYNQFMELIQERSEVTKPENVTYVPLKYKKPRSAEKVALPAKSPPEKTGIDNSNNTCYINSVIQALYMCDRFREQMLIQEFPGPAQKLVALQRVFAFLKFSQRLSINCNEYARANMPDYLEWGIQQDASEFANYLIDNLMEQEKNVPNDKLVTSSFYGVQRCTSRCLTCKKEFPRNFPFADLSLHFKDESDSTRPSSPQDNAASKRTSPLRNNSDVVLLEDLIGHMFETEKLEGDSQYSCDDCGRGQDGEKVVALTSTPDFLRITLNRFTFNRHGSVKIMTKVRIPRTLVLPVHTDDSTSNDIYCVVAVVVHSGAGTNYGHYTCIARNQTIAEDMRTADISDISNLSPETDYFTDNWFKFDDDTVTPVSFDNIADGLNRTPYILIYRKITNDVIRPVDGTDAKVPAELMELIEKDNKRYKELSARRRQSPPMYRPAPYSSNWRGDDSDDDTPRSQNNFCIGPRLVC